MSQVRVEIDLNNIDNMGLTKTRITNAQGIVKKGDIVVAFEPEDEVRASAYVERVDSVGGYIYLIVNRETMTDDAPSSLRFQGKASMNAQAAVAKHAVRQRAGSLVSSQGDFGLNLGSSIDRVDQHSLADQ
ncbi:hypothetical protein [Agreia pratensis]|uniref:Uncharacterized protein n=1 Tax=Agreia pratensis TaxID=150121 RepID=A0A1X7K2A1_9MICO|nr:hypothetical protein [Agreia pratensis]SMG34792.1 hypothetical protein SAMN06296010_1989 [Agreia pratensis]